jgi:histidinol-phosphate aminotransferase
VVSHDCSISRGRCELREKRVVRASRRANGRYRLTAIAALTGARVAQPGRNPSGRPLVRQTSSSPSQSVSTRVSRRIAGRALAATALGFYAWPRAVEAAASSTIDAAVAAAGAPIRIGANENPYGLGPAAIEAIRNGLGEANRYGGGGGQQKLASDLSAVHGVPQEQILITPGSGEILRAATTAFGSPTRSLVSAAPTFEQPGRVAAQIGAPIHALPVLASGSLDLPAMAAKAEGAGLFFVCNPNNPTGGASSAASVQDFIARVRGVNKDAVILIDEAYFEYVDDPGYATAIPLVAKDPRLVVSRTFSKVYGMAGLRVGYAIGQPDVLAAMRRHASQGTLSGVSAAAAVAALADRAHTEKQKALNRDARGFTIKAFASAGYHVLPSEANFVMVDVRRPASGVQAMCRESGVVIARAFPPLTNYARISIGTMDEMRRAVDVMLPKLAAPASASIALANPGLAWEGECC